MTQEEPTSATKAGVLLAIGAVFGLVGLVLFAGGSVTRDAVPEDASEMVVGILTLGPQTLIASGGSLIAIAAVVLSIDWFQRKT
jgi:drug/metabolite transporter (DMT)-like permease